MDFSYYTRLWKSIIVYAFIIPTLSAKSSISSPSNPGKAVLKLIHSDSINPRKHPPDSTSSYGNQSYLPEKPLAPVVASDFKVNFLVNITIGKPPVNQLVTMDTGSSLLWIQCQPCQRCRASANPIYNPRSSTTFHNSSCHEKYCDQVPGGDCDLENHCMYSLGYLDGSSSTGLLGFETLAFETFDGEQMDLPGVLFGCGTNNFDKDRVADGVFGLGGRGTAILRSTREKFSYCIGNISNPSYEYNQLALGGDAYLIGDAVPFELKDGKYFVSLEGISFDGTEIDIDPVEFEDNVMIDSGATLTFFTKDLVENIKSLVRKFIGPRLQEVPTRHKYDLLCYSGNVARDLRHFPPLVLKLGWGTEIEIGKESLFWTLNPEFFCMAISGFGNRNKIGVILQQYYNVGFDLNTQLVFFKRIDCESLDL